MSFLLDTTMRMSVVILVSLLAARALRHRSAALRHWVLALGIVGAAATPLFQLALPSWHVSIGGFSRSADVQQQGSEIDTAIAVQTLAYPGRQAAHSPASLEQQDRAVPIPAAPLLWLWAAGALLSVSTLLAGLWQLARAASAARPIETGPLVEMAANIQKAIGLRRPVTLLQSEDPSLLVTWGTARPKVILPDDAPRWSANRARVVLQHEFAHIARADWLVQMLAEALRAVYWFNPLLWVACRQLRDASERACDDAVLGCGGVDAADYASHLLELAQHATGPRPTPALGMARSSSLEGRVSAMLNIHTRRGPLGHATRLVTVVAFAALTVPIAIAQARLSALGGSVVDQTNRIVPDATLLLINAATQARHEVRTDRAGHFEFVGLPPGEYQLEAQQVGFKTFKETVPIADRDVSRIIHLQIGSVQETVKVTGSAATTGSSQPRQAKLEQARQRAQEIRQRASDKCGSGPTRGDVGGEIIPPLKLTDVRPEYPEALKAAGIDGVVTLDALIGTDGAVRAVTVVSSPHAELERAALDAVRGWQFSTTYLNCTPIEVPMRVTVKFVAP